jgi:hypothetical protein
LGVGTEEAHGKPVPVLGGLTFASVSAGELHTCGVTTSDDAYCWGLGDERIGSDLIDDADPATACGSLRRAKIRFSERGSIPYLRCHDKWGRLLLGQRKLRPPGQRQRKK